MGGKKRKGGKEAKKRGEKITIEIYIKNVGRKGKGPEGTEGQ